MAKTPLHLRCPICKSPVKSADPEFPFCSKRCRTIDLGRWASGHYVISSPVRDTDEDMESGSLPNKSDEDEA